MSKINLYKETVDAVDRSGHKTCDVSSVFFLSDFGYRKTTWADFASVAVGIDYDNGYGSVEISLALKIVFHDGSWLERESDDGSEWWEFREVPREQSACRMKKGDIYEPMEEEE